mgnify:CR=1 FL=1
MGSIQEEIESLAERYLGELMAKDMTSPNTIRDCGDALRMINEPMVLNLHAQLRCRPCDSRSPLAEFSERCPTS